MKKKDRRAPFYGLHSNLPILLALLLGYPQLSVLANCDSFQHALAMLAGIVTPPLILGGAANLNPDQTQYLISASLIVCGILSAIQITRFHLFKTPYYLGTGLIRFVPHLFFFFWGILRLMAVWSELHSPQSQLPPGLWPNGTPTEHAPSMLREMNSRVRMATVRFWGPLVFAHYLKLD
jgi:Permease family